MVLYTLRDLDNGNQFQTVSAEEFWDVVERLQGLGIRVSCSFYVI